MNDSLGPSAVRRSWPRRTLNRLEVDQAVFFALAARGWQFIAGPVTIVLIGTFFTKEVQGYYYTFWSLIALQTIFDFSFPQVIINFASHEWQRLTLTPEKQIAGDADSASRVASLLRASLLWYAAAAVIFMVLVSSGGLVFFAQADSSDQVAWRAPWLTLVAFTALTFWTTPCLAVLEGCDQVRSVYQLHFARAVSGNLIVWLLIPLGAQLWVPAASAIVRLTCELCWLCWWHRHFFQTFLRKPAGATIHWRTEVWPFQWRVGFKGLLSFFNTFLINPIVFYYHGEVAAGRLGMTWQILTSLQAACASWVKARTAKFGMLVAKRDYAELDRIFFRLLTLSGTILSIGACAVLALVYGLHHAESPFAERLLAPLPTALLALAVVIVLVPESQWTYIHAHKESPHLALTIIGSLLSGVLLWTLGSRYGATGVSLGYLMMTGLYYLPLWSWVWWSCRSTWHSDRDIDCQAASGGIRR